jgi:hypothetical protein
MVQININQAIVLSILASSTLAAPLFDIEENVVAREVNVNDLEARDP